MEKKYIHYCWFGDKQFPKLGKKCLESWKKYLPDYEIIKWSEENVDLNECPFVKGAYENKKWAFVADYVRCKALKEYGGIYFDTDMEVIKNFDNLLDCNTFLGVEDSGYVAVGVWYEKNKDALLPTKLLEVYNNMKEFNINKMADVSIPKLISDVLKDYGLAQDTTEVQHLKDDIKIYPRDYFYPYSYNRDNNVFTDNTCMIHYYDASWIPVKERIENEMVRRFGKEKTAKIMNTYRKTAKVALFPLAIYKKKKRKQQLISEQYLTRLNETINKIKEYKNKDYIVFHNKNWMGITSATKELFTNTVDCGEIYREEDVKKIVNAIIENNINQVIFSSFAIGYKDIVQTLKEVKPSIKIKTYWHGSHSQIHDAYGWERNLEIIDLHKQNKVDVMASCKESLNNFYKKQGYNAVFLTNKVDTDVKPSKRKKDGKVKIGLYAAKCDDWRKNMFTQMAAAALIDNSILDMVPLNDTAKEFADILGLEITGEEKPLPREELIKRMSQNDINLYITFSECAPMLPLESFEMNVPCITGNNHHYFKNTELEEYIVVMNENDPEEIKEKIEKCLASPQQVLDLYKDFNRANKDLSKKQMKDYLEM